MAETQQNMISIIYNETVYSLLYIPTKDSQVVEEKMKHIENQINLDQFCKESIINLGGLVQLAYFGVVGHASLQREVRPALGDVNDLCDSIIQALNGVKRSLHGALIRIQTAYEYLENSSEANALQMLNGLKIIVEKLSLGCNSPAKQCYKKAELLLQIHHETEKRKEIVEDEARKQENELMNIKTEKSKCQIFITKSKDIVSKENKKINECNKSIEKVSKEKTKRDEKYKKDLENATNKCEKELSKLKSKYDSKLAKLIENFQKKQKKLDTEVEKHKKASGSCRKSTDEKLMQGESSKHDHFVDEYQGKNTCQLNKKQISKDHQSIQSSDPKETKKTNGTDIVQMNYTCSAENVEVSSLSVNDSTEPQLIAAEAKNKPEDMQRPQEASSHLTAIENKNKDTPTPLSQHESTKASSKKEETVNEAEKAMTKGNETSSTAISNVKDSKSAMKEKELALEEQKEALLQEYVNNKQRIEKAKTDIQTKYQADIEKLDKQLEKYNQQITTSKTMIKDNEQTINEYEQKIPELEKNIAEKEKVTVLNNTSIKCIGYAIEALYNIGSIMKQLGNFLEDFTALCHQLNDCTLFKQIEYLQNRKELWKSSAFKLVMLNCYGNYVAFTSICTTAVECITKAQEEVYQNVSKNLSRDEAFKLVQEEAPKTLPQVKL